MKIEKIKHMLPQSILENDSIDNILKAFMIANKQIMKSKEPKSIIKISNIRHIREIL